MKKVRRTYKGSDGKLMEVSLVLHGLFLKNLPSFEAFDSELDANFASQWKTSIDSISGTMPYGTMRDIQGQRKEEVDAIMDKCQAKYIDAKYFALKAFPRPMDKLKEFGQGEYNKIRSRPEDMDSFLNQLHTVCTKYKTELNAKGFTMANIDEIQTIREELVTAHTIHQNYKKAKTSRVMERINLLNQCHQMTMQVVNASKIIFREDYAMLRMFRFLE